MLQQFHTINVFNSSLIKKNYRYFQGTEMVRKLKKKKKTKIQTENYK